VEVDNVGVTPIQAMNQSMRIWSGGTGGDWTSRIRQHKKDKHLFQFA